MSSRGKLLIALALQEDIDSKNETSEEPRLAVPDKVDFNSEIYMSENNGAKDLPPDSDNCDMVSEDPRSGMTDSAFPSSGDQFYHVNPRDNMLDEIGSQALLQGPNFSDIPIYTEDNIPVGQLDYYPINIVHDTGNIEDIIPCNINSNVDNIDDNNNNDNSLDYESRSIIINAPDLEICKRTKNNKNITIHSNLLLRASSSRPDVSATKSLETSIGEPAEIVRPRTSPRTEMSVEERDSAQFTKRGAVRKRKLFQESKTVRKFRKEEKEKTDHGVLPHCSCKQKCIVKIDEERRKCINQSYWQQNWLAKKSFVLNNISRTDVKRRSSGADNFLRNNTFKYSFKNQTGEKQNVCKTFFLTTLGYKKTNDWPIQYFMQKEKGFETRLHAEPDRRGRKPSTRKINTRDIEEHIESFNPCISHYRREHAPNRRYLPSDINIKTMYDDYIAKFPNGNCSYEVYRKVIKSKNISFAALGNEECELCEEFKLHNLAHNADNYDLECEVCQKWSKHINRAKETRNRYKQDAKIVDEPKTLKVSVDLQKVIMLPRVDMFKKVIFAQRIVVYNESFVPLGTTKKSEPFAVLWHEAMSGRTKEDIASAFYAFFLANRDIEHFVLWLDNCAAQNKNWTFMSLLVYMVNNSPQVSAKTITVNYFEPGHSFMSADSFHHQVELSLRKQNKTYDFADFVAAVQRSNSGRVSAKIMNPGDFFDWQDLSSQHKLRKQTPRTYLSDIIRIVAQRGKYTLEYNTAENYSENFSLDFLQQKVLKSGMKPAKSRAQPCGIPREKAESILKSLAGILPLNRREFWESLPLCPE